MLHTGLELAYPASMILAAGAADIIINQSGLQTLTALNGSLGAGLGGYAAVEFGFNPMIGSMIALSVQDASAIGRNLGMSVAVAFVAPYIFAFLVKEEIQLASKK